MNDETLIGLSTIKAAIKECGSANNIPVTLDNIKAAEKSHQLYVEHIKRNSSRSSKRQLRNKKKLRRRGNWRKYKLRKGGCMKKLQALKDEENAAQEAMERSTGYIHQGGKKISGRMKTNDMVEMEAGYWP